MSRKEPVCIYGLKDPRDGRYYYIGKAANPLKRFKAHLKDKNNKLKAAWLDDLRSVGSVVIVDVFQEVDVTEWQEAEKAWIAQGRLQGWPLTNIAAGGQGHSNAGSTAFVEPLLTTEQTNRFRALSWQQRVGVCVAAGKALMPFISHYIRESGHYEAHRATLAAAKAARSACESHGCES